MTNQESPGKERSALEQFAVRLERGSPLVDVCSDRQLEPLQEIVARASQDLQQAWTAGPGRGVGLTGSRGPTSLFAGTDGAAKILAVAALGSELGLDLYRVDLTHMVSKYIGETEKNLARIFEEAAEYDAILFFDEADALFGKRSEVKDTHDRYANMEVAYFFQRVEAYPGLVIISVNTSEGLSEDLLRRLGSVVEFSTEENP